MTDKEIVERAKEAEKRTSFGELVHSPISKGVNSAYGIGFIEGMLEYRNSMQEEPTEVKKECMYSKEFFMNKDRKVLCDGCEEDCKYNKKEDVSDDLEKIVEEIAEPTILNAYGTKELARRLRNTIYGTSVSEDLEQAIDTYLATYFGGEKEKQDWPFLKKIAIHFANWQKQKDSIPVSEDLGEYINELSKQFPEVSFAKLSRIAVRVAKWKEGQINEILLSEVLPCFMHGGEADEVVAKLEEVLNKKNK